MLSYVNSQSEIYQKCMRNLKQNIDKLTRLRSVQGNQVRENFVVGCGNGQWEWVSDRYFSSNMCGLPNGHDDTVYRKHLNVLNQINS